MAKILICYTFEFPKKISRIKLKRKLFGSTEKTHKGKYTAITKGVLTNIKYRKPVNSTILVDEKHEQEIIKILKQFSAKIEILKIAN